MESKTKHTPGPWKWRANSKDIDIYGNGKPLLRMHDVLNTKMHYETQANARLIAAAPEMLSALTGMNHMGGDEKGGYCICPLKDGSAPNEKHSSSCSAARQAIEKAE